MDKKQKRAPGKSYREGIGIIEHKNMFMDEDIARRWLKSIVWKKGKTVFKCCNGTNTYEAKNGELLPHKFRDCRKHFSFRHGSIFEGSHIPLRKWAITVNLVTKNLKSIPSMKLHRELNVTQKSAWYMLHRIRESFASKDGMFYGEVEVDETFVGGLEKNKRESKKLKQGRGATGKTADVGAKERRNKKVKAQVVFGCERKKLNGFVAENVETGKLNYTDDFKAYHQMANYSHQFVKHDAVDYVNEMVHTNGLESFLAMLKRAHNGTYHKMSVKHLRDM